MTNFNLKNFIIVNDKTMKLSKVINSIEGLNQLAKTKLPVSLGFRISTAINNLNPLIENYYKTRNELLKKHGKEVIEKDKPTGRYDIPKEKVDEFNKELEELNDTEIDVKLPEIKLSELGNIEIEPSALVNLDWLIVE